MKRAWWQLSVVAVMVVGLGAVAAEKAANLLKNPDKPASWQFEQHEQARGTMTAAPDGGILFDVTNVDGEAWHVQVFMHDVTFKEGKEYTLTYKAKAEPARSITATATIDEDDWHAIGLQEEVELTKDWKEQTHTFKAENVVKAGKNRLGFFLGNEKGKVWVKDVSLVEK